MRRGLVERDDPRALGKRERDPHALPFARRERAEFARAQCGEFGCRERVADGRMVGVRRLPFPPAMIRKACGGDRIVDRHRRECGFGRFDERHALGARARIEGRDVGAVEHDAAACRCEHAAHGCQQRRLSDAVRAHQRRERTRREHRVDVAQERAAAAGDRESGELQHR